MLNWLPFISYVFVTTFTPGPNNIMSMTNAHEYGFRKTMRFNLGVFAGFIVIMLLCSYMSLFLAGVLPRFSLFMAVLGAGYMLYLAGKIVRSTGDPHADGKGGLNSFWAGLWLQFLNPKVILYGITVVANFVIPYNQSDVSLVLFSVLLAFIGFVSTTCWALFGVLFQRLLSSYRRPFNWLMALLLVYCAVSVFL
jgi:threonine/homoserine/homoserine lactone efflux protein